MVWPGWLPFGLVFGLVLFAPVACDGPRAVPPELQVPRGGGAMEVDGVLGEAEWDGAARIRSLPAFASNGTRTDAEGIDTDVYLRWDKDFLYIGFQCVDSDILATHTEHDADLWKEDVVEVFLDPVGDGRHYMEIQANAKGTVLDKLYLATDTPVSDENGVLKAGWRRREWWELRSWTLKGLQVAGRIVHEEGRPAAWTVEFAIPAEALGKRYGVKILSPGMTLRCNLVRHEYRPNADSEDRELIAAYWAPVVFGSPHLSPAAMGRLVLTDEEARTGP